MRADGACWIFMWVYLWRGVSGPWERLILIQSGVHAICLGDRVAGPSDFLHIHGFVWSVHPKANTGLPVHLTTPQITTQEHFQFVLLT